MKRLLYEILAAPAPGDRLSKAFDIFIIALILLNLVSFVLGTVESLYASYKPLFDWIEYVSLGVFTVEYIGRVWTCDLSDRYRGWSGRARFVASPLMVIDLLAILPGLLPFVGADLRVLRAFRIVRLLRVLKLARYSESIQLIGRVLVNKRGELITAMGMILIMILFASTVLYYAERHAQPETFGSIPHAMWWAVATLTTVGYGDVYPITIVGKLCGAVVAILGITLFAVPTGILAAAFQEENARRRRRES